MSSLDELASAIAAAITQAEHTGTATEGAIDTAGQVSTAFAGLGAESAVQQATAIGHKLGEAKTHLAAFTKACNEAAQMTQSAKTGLPTPAADPPPPSPPAAESRAPNFDAAPYLDDMPSMPDRTSTSRRRPPTHGRWVGAAGGPEKLISGRDHRTAQVDTAWSKVRREDEPEALAIATHIEPKMAMTMREHGLTNERIVINNPDGPCGYQRPLPYGCDKVMPRLLPPDATLTVSWPDGGETTYKGRTQ